MARNHDEDQAQDQARARWEAEGEGISELSETEQDRLDRAIENQLFKNEVHRRVAEMETERELQRLLEGVGRRYAKAVMSVLAQLQRAPQIEALFEQGRSRKQILAMKHPGFLVEQTIPFGDYTSMFGAPGTFKTHICGALCRACEHGEPWFDYYATRRAVTAYWSGEGIEQFQPQFLAQGGVSLNGAAPGLWWDEPLDLSDTTQVVAIVIALERLRRLGHVRHGLCIFDPDGLFRGGTAGEIENTEPLARALRALARGLPNWAFIAVGHTEASGQRHRGTDHIKQLAGAHVKVERGRIEDEVVMLWEKIRGADHQAIWVARRIVENTGGIVVENARERKFTLSDYVREKRKTKARVEKITGGSASKYAAILKLAPSRAAKGESGTWFAEKLGSRALVLKAVKELVEDGRLENVGTETKPLYVRGGEADEDDDGDREA
jgi:hypothetical protein